MAQFPNDLNIGKTNSSHKRLPLSYKTAAVVVGKVRLGRGAQPASASQWGVIVWCDVIRISWELDRPAGSLTRVTGDVWTTWKCATDYPHHATHTAVSQLFRVNNQLLWHTGIPFPLPPPHLTTQRQHSKRDVCLSLSVITRGQYRPASSNIT